MEEKKKGKGKTIVIVVLILIILGLASYIVYDKDLLGLKKEEATKEEKTEDAVTEEDASEDVDEEVTTNLDFDFDGMENDLLEKMENEPNTEAYITSCEDPTGDLSQANTTYQKVSNESIHTIINKLKTAQSYEEATASFFCPKYAYSITQNIGEESENNYFSLNYANDELVLLIGYGDKGYAFTFSSADEIADFIENLQ